MKAQHQLIGADPDGEKTTGAITIARNVALRHCQTTTRNPGGHGPGAGIEDHVSLAAGLWQFQIVGSILPIAFRIGQNVSDDWFLRTNYELLRGISQDPVLRLINPGDELRWRPLFGLGILPPSLNLVCLARTNTRGG